MLKWSESYETGIKEIDSQHHKLFDIGDHLYQLITDDKDIDYYDDISKILQDLSNYANYHFDYEEKLLEKFNFPLIVEQKVEHNFFIKKLKTFDLYEIDENQQEELMNLIKFVSNWIISHILKNDMKYKNHLLNALNLV